MLNEVFSDYFARKDNFLTGIDARIKIFFVFGALLTTLSSQTPHLPAVVAFGALAFLMCVRIPLKMILLRLLAPLSVATVILLIQFFFYGREGLFRAALIMGKVAGGVSLIIFLSMTTPLNNLLNAAAWFRIPKTWLEIAALTYRYVFVLIEDAVIIRDAQKVRLGYCNIKTSLRSLAELTGACFIRAYDRSLSACEAMKARGYSGSAKVSFEKKFKIKDVLHLAVFSLILALLVILSLYRR